jgi:hypothetical protein
VVRILDYEFSDSLLVSRLGGDGGRKRGQDKRRLHGFGRQDVSDDAANQGAPANCGSIARIRVHTIADRGNHALDLIACGLGQAGNTVEEQGPMGNRLAGGCSASGP